MILADEVHSVLVRMTNVKSASRHHPSLTRGAFMGTDSQRASSEQSSPTCTPRSAWGPTGCCVCI